ncbi:glycosyltransferase family 4 protein [Synechococcus sp. UW179A]|uniref:glycosyltransferase family 4 protein n=1 Tax=Synechococcus sp. UW179A TaxID=2575510 RepID=UPI0010BE8C49|nr:glycosyltransferase family 4 protein [Synechococcus sp. UW179A]
MSSLFAFISSIISQKYTVYIVDFPNGALANLSKTTQVTCISPDELVDLSYNIDLVIVTQALPLWRLPNINIINSSTKLFFWFLHPDNFEIIPKYRQFFSKFNYFFRKRNFKLISQYSLMLEFQSLYFMDHACYYGLLTTLSLSTTNPSYNCPILRLVHNPMHTICPARSSVFSKNFLTITWIGRLEDFKSQSLLSFVQDLVNSNCSLDNIKLHIVGDGIDFSSLKRKFSCIPINITFHGTLSFDELDDLLVSTDIGFAMGLSLLEFASRGIPCLIADFGYRQSLSAGYCIFGEQRLDLGSPHDLLINMQHFKLKTLGCAIDYILSDYKEISANTSNVYLTTYYYKSTIDLFESAISSSRLTVRDVLSSDLLFPDLLSILVSLLALSRNQFYSAAQRNSIYGGFSWLL